VTGTILGIGRIVGDTAIAVLLLGGTVLAPFAAGWWQPDQATGTLRGPGSTLTTYIYYASPAGEGNTAGKAYGAAFVLMVVILVVNYLVRLTGRRRGATSWR
jgi:phosphate transport system permease protein